MLHILDLHSSVIIIIVTQRLLSLFSDGQDIICMCLQQMVLKLLLGIILYFVKLITHNFLLIATYFLLKRQKLEMSYLNTSFIGDLAGKHLEHVE